MFAFRRADLFLRPGEGRKRGGHSGSGGRVKRDRRRLTCIYRAAGKKCVFYLSDKSLFSSASINVPDTRVT